MPTQVDPLLVAPSQRVLAQTRRIGIHLATGGGAATAAERAREIGANTFQIFSSSPRMWKAHKILPEQAKRVRAIRAEFDIAPAVVHASYLINVCSQNEDVRQKSIHAFRGEIERALTLGCEYLVLHPGSWKGLSRERGLELAAESITEAIENIEWQGNDFHILIENTAGAEFSARRQLRASRRAGGAAAPACAHGGVP